MESNSPIQLTSTSKKEEDLDLQHASMQDTPADEDMSEIGSIDDGGLEQEPGAMPYSANFARVNNLMDLHFEVVLKLVGIGQPSLDTGLSAHWPVCGDN